MRIIERLKDIYWGWFVVTGAFLVLGVSYGAMAPDIASGYLCIRCL
ncbi:MAG: hypothetical protein JRC53_06030 [Deltaproteobacteria bacterium]|nr:hypothetical protein [Deltaproteobacteria bacterium]